MGWSELLDTASQRHGIVVLADAAAHGVPRSTLLRRAATEAWVRLHPGVYLVAGARDTDIARHVAAVLATGGVLARRSALWMHQAARAAPHPPEVIVPATRVGTRTHGIRVTRSRTLTEDDVTTVRGVPTTTVARTVADLAAAGWSARRLRALVIDVERDGLLTREDLVALLGRLRPGVPGRGRVAQALDDLRGMRSDSTTEQDVRGELRRLGYPVHHGPFPFVCDDGVTVHLDLALRDHWVHVEVDGFGPHSQRRVFETDRVRWTQIVRHWRPVWVTWQRWHEDRAAVLADLDAAIALADPDRPPARANERAPTL